MMKHKFNALDENIDSLITNSSILLKQAESALNDVNRAQNCEHIFYLHRVVSSPGLKDYEYVCIKCGTQFISDEKIEKETNLSFHVINGRGATTEYLNSLYKFIKKQNEDLSDGEITTQIENALSVNPEDHTR